MALKKDRALAVCPALQDLADAMDQSLDLVAFTAEVPELRFYLSEHFASEEKLTKEQQDELDRRSVSFFFYLWICCGRKNGPRGSWRT